MQKSLREGFGLTVSEALWKGRPVIGGRCGGITMQINEGENGHLVDSVESAAQRTARAAPRPGPRRRDGRDRPRSRSEQLPLDARARRLVAAVPRPRVAADDRRVAPRAVPVRGERRRELHVGTRRRRCRERARRAHREERPRRDVDRGRDLRRRPLGGGVGVTRRSRHRPPAGRARPRPAHDALRLRVQQRALVPLPRPLRPDPPAALRPSLPRGVGGLPRPSTRAFADATRRCRGRPATSCS